MKQTTLCYLERDGQYLMLHRVKKQHDENHDKWIGVGGKFEDKESPEDCVRREVLEETGIRINIQPDFVTKSQYTIQGKVEKNVNIFLASTQDTQTVIQKEEIEEYIWLGYEKALNKLRFENDRNILSKAYNYLLNKKIITE